MKPIAIHIDRLSSALAAKGVDLKRTDLLQIAAAAFGYHNQNEASAASQRGDLTPPPVTAVCRVSVPTTPHGRSIVVLQDATSGLAYGVDSEFFDRASSERSEFFGPTPFGGMADLRGAVHNGGGIEVQEIGFSAHLDRALTEAHRLQGLLDDITGQDDSQAEQLAWAENALSRLIGALRGGADTMSFDKIDEEGRSKPSDAQKASYRRDVAGMSTAIAQLEEQMPQLAYLTPATAQWAHDCMDALHAGLRIAEDWKAAHEQEVRFGPDWKSWTKDLKKASTRGAAPISDADLHKLRHAVADNHTKSSEGERSQVQWRAGQMMQRHARSLLLRLDIAEALLPNDDMVDRGDPAPSQPVLPADAGTGEWDRRDWTWNLERAGAMQDAIVLCANNYMIDRRMAIASLGATFGFDHTRSNAIIQGKDLGVKDPEFLRGKK